ncbi:V8-like Glu-specific endopeptidase [Nocardioides thalensis]|uniref:V8-like Glu-specific endopeptidase n=1 Tax=Nocardioides thalensis TaxID=1914755 RepID=A0A853C3N6_9ACTN|nr:trypsin-like peptidase domain-containing protein [Nocardioides thalensis]NYJ01188.1 V8-like Glu-specific endopeptidase [Nocardioides thalensis]
MTPVRRLGVVLVTGLALVAGTGSIPANGGATAPATTALVAESADDDVSSYAGAVGPQTSKRAVLDYWTPERMAAARPIEEVLGLLPEVDASVEPAGAVPAARGRVPVPKTAGKLFFTTNQGGAVCSAATVKSRRGNQVITAGHCVNSGPGGQGWFDNFLFVPKYHKRRAPYGKWAYSRVWAFNGWINDGKFRYDQAVIQFQKRNGRKLARVTGANRVKLGANQRQRGVRIWGWPAEGPRYNGQVAKRCDGPTKRRGRTQDAIMRCPMTGGASGGPWLLKKGRKKNTGIIWAVTSRRTIGSRPKLLLAAPLPRATKRLIH